MADRPWPHPPRNARVVCEEAAARRATCAPASMETLLDGSPMIIERGGYWWLRHIACLALRPPGTPTSHPILGYRVAGLQVRIS